MSFVFSDDEWGAIDLDEEYREVVESIVLRYRNSITHMPRIQEFAEKYAVAAKLGRAFLDALKRATDREELVGHLQESGVFPIPPDPIAVVEDVVMAMEGSALAWEHPELMTELDIGRPLRRADAAQARLVYDALTTWHVAGRRVGYSTNPATDAPQGPCVRYLKTVLHVAMGDDAPADATLKTLIRNHRKPKATEAIRRKVQNLL